MSLFDFSGFYFYYLLFMIFFIGTCIGSFSNVVVLRAFSGESIVLPPSKCPSCHNKLKWYHNIPVLSYLFLKGACGFCKEKISVQYPLIELTIGLLFLFIFLKYDLTLNALFIAVMATLGVILAATDIKEQVIFDAHAYILAFVGLVYNFFNISQAALGVFDFNLLGYAFSINKTFVFALLGLVAGALIMEALAFLGKLFAGKRAFGEGDSFILGALGACFGIGAIPLILVFSLVLQVVLILPMFIKKLFNNKEYKLIASLVLFAFLTAVFKILDMYSLLDNVFVFGVFLSLMLINAFYACRKLIQSTKEGSDLTYVAFGPALIFAAFIVKFFS